MKIIFIVFLFLFGSLTVSAEDITPKVDITIPTMTINQTKKLVDKNKNTKINVDKNITIKSNIHIKYIYIIWDKPPDNWTLQHNEAKEILGKYGFMHELVELNVPLNEFSLNITKGTICEIYFFDKELPDFVEQWKPPQKCDILLFPTHADDEHIFFGGIMPMYADSGKIVQVAYLTNHFGEPYRPHEALEGLWKVGVKNYPIMPKFNDYYSSSLKHAKTLYNTDEMLSYQVEMIRRFKPKVVIGHDVDGEYGHGVHMLNTFLLKQAVELSGQTDSYIDSTQKYGAYSVPKTYLHLYKDGEIVLNYDTPLKNGKTAFEMAVSGFAKHISQQKYFKVEQWGKYDCRKFGLFRSTVGDDILKKDLFENIPIEQAQIIDTFNENTPKNDIKPIIQPYVDETTKINVDYIMVSIVLVALIISIKLIFKRNNK